ncbi:MAG TPA: hypothetical protein VHG88_07700 [Burkholderiales bacterium]|nr:hypothetical protein [Burkholderiales bacterium]
MRFFIAALLLSSCATLEQELDEVKSAWQGASYDEVVTRWGPPARSAMLSDGRQTHTWVSQEAPISGGGPQVGVGVFGGSGGGGVGVGIGFPFGTTVNRASCERTLTFREQAVVEQRWSGDPGYCRFFKRSP